MPKSSRLETRTPADWRLVFVTIEFQKENQKTSQSHTQSMHAHTTAGDSIFFLLSLMLQYILFIHSAFLRKYFV